MQASTIAGVADIHAGEVHCMAFYPDIEAEDHVDRRLGRRLGQIHPRNWL